MDYCPHCRQQKPTTHTVGASLPVAGADYEDVCQACYEAHQKRRHVRITRKIFGKSR
jgi:hypothetical protein